MNIIVTGGTGYIGSITAYLLSKSGFRVGIIDNLENSHKSLILKNTAFFKGNILNKKFLEETFKIFLPEVIFHFASYTSIKESFSRSLNYYNNNVVGSYSLFSVALKYNVNKIIFSSSAAVYGKTKNVMIDETNLTEPINPYGETKLAVEKMLKWLSGTYNFQTICLRYFNVAGAMLNGSFGKKSISETHLIPNIINNALTNKEVLINGNNYNTPDGTCIRDYIHVLDLANVNLLALKSILKRQNSLQTIYNVGSGKGYSNKEIVEATANIIGRKIKIKYIKPRKGDPPILVADPTKIKNELGFQSKYSDLNTIIKSQLTLCLKKQLFQFKNKVK